MRHTISLLLLATGLTTLAANPEHSLPIFFIPNAGEADPTIRYIAQTPGMTVGFTPDSAIFRIQGTQLRVDFAGASPNTVMEGTAEMPARANFLIGDACQSIARNRNDRRPDNPGAESASQTPPPSADRTEPSPKGGASLRPAVLHRH